MLKRLDASPKHHLTRPGTGLGERQYRQRLGYPVGCTGTIRAVMSSSSSARPTAWYRPVAVPDDVDAPWVVKASGRIELPPHVRWSGDRVYDLDDVADRMSVYKQVLSHGVAEDVRRFIRVEELARLWRQMILPSYVRDVWGPWLHRRGLL